MDLVATCPEGASYFTVTTELGIARTRAAAVLEKLHTEGKLSFDCKTKMYFPAPAAKVQPDHEEGKNDPQEDRPVPGRVRCPIEGCGVELKGTWSNVYVHLRKRHKLPPTQVRAYLERLLPGESEPSASVECRYCGRKFKNSSGRAGHEQRCAKNPALVPKAEETPTGLEALTEVRAESVPVAVMEGAPRPEHWVDEVQVSTTSEPMQVMVNETGTVQYDVVVADPLALFAKQHRVRVGREISKLRKVERKLRWHAASAGAMADRVRSARRIKERELRRFERDLAEAVR